MSKIAIIGPGSIGGTVAAWLSQDSRHEVCVAVRTAFDRIEVETPSGLITATPRILTDTTHGAPVDWVLIATKAYDTGSASKWLKGLCKGDTLVGVLQNGVEHVERFSPHVPAGNILPVVVDLPAERRAPGRILQRRFGSMIVPAGLSGSAFVDLFSKTPIDVSQSDDFKTQAWRKLCINSAGALSAVLLKPADISRREPIAELMRGIVRECVAVGRAEGAKLDDSLVETVIEGYRSAPPDSLNSMHADRQAGRPMEIDARNGVIVRLGRKHGIATPLNVMLVALLEAAQGE